MSKKYKPKAWALVSPDGDVMVTSIATTKSQSQAIADANFRDFQREGWKVQRVTITPITSAS